RICQAFEDLRAEVGKAKVAFVAPEYDPEVNEAVEDFLSRRLDDVAYHPDKAERDEKISSLKREMKDALAERWPDQADVLGTLFEKKLKDRVRQRVIEEGVRMDGRGTKDVREITVQVGVLP